MRLSMQVSSVRYPNVFMVERRVYAILQKIFYIYVKSCAHGKSNFHGCPIFPSRYFYAFNETGVPLTYSCAYYVTHSA